METERQRMLKAGRERRRYTERKNDTDLQRTTQRASERASEGGGGLWAESERQTDRDRELLDCQTHSQP